MSTGMTGSSLGYLGYATIVVLLLMIQTPRAFAIEDNFENTCLGGKECLNKSLWWEENIIEDDQFEIQNRSAFRGDAAARVSVDDGFWHDCKVKKDDGVEREICTQKTEVWERRRIWRRYGKAGWYGFSFRVEGDIRERQSERFVIAQWKREESGSSPFLALRFDNGVFHITLQDDHPTKKKDVCRVLLAKAPGALDAISNEFSLGLGNSPCLWENEIGRDESNIKVTGPNDGLPKLLPDPCVGWIDIVFFVRTGNKKDGEIRVYAAPNQFATPDDLVAIAKGHIFTRGKRNGQYFKFGIYRDFYKDLGILPFAMVLDEYRRGDDADDVFVTEAPEVASLEALTEEIPTRECNLRPKDD